MQNDYRDVKLVKEEIQMKLFNDLKKISVGYFEHESNIHRSMMQPLIVLIMTLKPSVSAIRDRLFQTYPVVSIENFVL